jgi:uncharacterized membrane protein
MSPQHDKNQTNSSDPVWTFRGYRIEPGEFNTAMVHFYRGEITRANTWRQRLDATTNWAVITTGAAITFAFGQPDGHHSLIILNALLIAMFWFVEARRYRYYELWSSRVRLMETDFYAAMLVPPFHPSPDWAETLAESLLQPSLPISMWEALGRRLRRNYMWIYLVLLGAWVLKIAQHPTTIYTLPEFIERAHIGILPGEVILICAVIWYVLLLILGLLTLPLRSTSGEVLPRFGTEAWAGIDLTKNLYSEGKAWFRPSRRRQEFMALIITEQAPQVAERILEDMGRGVTALEGTGMYTGKSRSVLLSAITVTEVAQLKKLVSAEDENGFVIIMPAQEVRGGQFRPLKKPKKT